MNVSLQDGDDAVQSSLPTAKSPRPRLLQRESASTRELSRSTDTLTDGIVFAADVSRNTLDSESGALAPNTAGAGDRHGRLLLAALLESFCRLSESNSGDPRRAERLFTVLCRTLSAMGILDADNVDELASVRSAYSRAFRQLMAQARQAIDLEDMALAQPPDAHTPPPDALVLRQHQPPHVPSARPTPLLPHLAPGASLDDWLGLDDSRYRNEWEELAMLGRGGFGAVYRARNKMDDVEYAVKRVHLPSAAACVPARGAHPHTKVFREIKALARLHHPNIIRYFSSWLEHSRQDDHSQGWLALTGPGDTLTDETSEDGGGSARFVTEDEGSNDIVFEETHASNGRSTISTSTEEGSLSDLSSSVEYISRETATGQAIAIRSRRAFPSPHGNSLPRRHTASVPASSPRLMLYIQMHLCSFTLRDYLVARDARFHQSTEPGRTIAKPECLSLLKAILTGVAHVHAQGLAHRDLKPTNVFLALTDDPCEPGAVAITTSDLSSDGHPTQRFVVPKLGDFGLALLPTSPDTTTTDTTPLPPLPHSPADVTRAGLGTPTYAAPEQQTPMAQASDPRSGDMYSIAIILFELLHPHLNPSAPITRMERALLLSDLRNLLELPPPFISLHPTEAALILSLSCKTPHLRPTAGAVLASGVLDLPALRSNAPETERDRLVEENQKLRARVQALELAAAAAAAK
ncbi:hypothetical protein PYCC9005_006002 [Savitreella phatthalungensis]